MKKTLLILFLAVAVLPLYAESIQYVYGNSLSGTDLENPRTGKVYTDGNRSLFIVSSVHDSVSVLDRIYTASAVAAGTTVYPRPAVRTIELQTNLREAGVRFSLTTPLYPLRGALEAGYSLNSKAPYLAGGICVDFPLSRISGTSFLLVEDGSIEGSFIAGAVFSNPVQAYIKWTVSYKLGIGKLVVGAGYGMSRAFSEAISITRRSVCVSAGVRL